jgi:ADP-heptose:LPS heptosyltransferase/predicted SAM-dependent methyltransferase
MIWRATDPEGNEAAKVKYEIVQYTRGLGLDIGCGPHKAFPHFIGVDSKKDTALFGIEMEPDNVVDDATRLPQVPDERLDFVFSSHLLEHIDDYQAALAEWWRVIRMGGHLVLYLPHRDLYPRIGQPGANIDHKHDFAPEDITQAMEQVAPSAGTGWDLVVNEVRGERNEYSFLQVYRKGPALDGMTRSFQRPRFDKTACISRFGGFGDMIQAANLLPELKRQGYHVTFNTTPKGQDILRHDPHIDAWLIQDDDQVPNHELPLFWAAQARRFTKFIQLSESIEGTLLAMPGRANHMWPHSVRAVELNKNYLEWLSQLAELPYTSEAKFYPSEDEAAEARAYLGRIVAARNPALLIGQRAQPVFTVMWVLSGSSMHKFYPWMDMVIARVLLEMPDAVFILNGDEACALLECGWELEPRVWRESGKIGIRASLTLARQVDCVIGPETGVLNAVAFEDNAKVVFLSHSSHENLTKHWRNTTPLEPWGQHCYPCHRLHYGKEFCDEHEDTGAAMCQVKITPDRAYDAIKAAYAAWKEQQP